jgi:separase
MLTRLGPSKSTAIEDPFAVDTLKDTLPQIGNDKVFSSRPQPSQKPLLNGENGLDAAQWRVAQGTLETLLALAHAYFMRGSVKEAEYFAQQAQDLAEAVSAHLMIARAVLQRAEIQVSMSKIAEATELLDKADVHLKDAMVVDHADALRLRGVCKGLSQDEDSARECYENASSALGKIERTLEKLESVK